MNVFYIFIYRPDPDYPTQPLMMFFKQFLSQQDDNISDEDAIKKYNEYKLDFKKTQISEFFLAHKDEEWYVLCRYICYSLWNVILKVYSNIMLNPR